MSDQHLGGLAGLGATAIESNPLLRHKLAFAPSNFKYGFGLLEGKAGPWIVGAGVLGFVVLAIWFMTPPARKRRLA